ncbi:hypothetical protein PI124_g10806 [Phytophthora idaei]|nr:hypothetical protein PI125_g21924 [Phytophthora idaei]KAG3131016.1 hypothetical protein PI126_g20237 [Phytophthora idaei]KAG3244416.1 hypothetical protein PI124_g10806 [Phytophthora idaei]
MTPRYSVEYTPTYQRFVLKEKSYAQQFSHIYVSRLQQLRDVVSVQVQEHTAGRIPVLAKVIDLKADGEECVLIGTLLKVLEAKPDLFDALTSEAGVKPIETIDRPLATKEDELLLEDESGRVQLVGNIDVARFVTGVVLGVRGRVARDGPGGHFHVEEVYVPPFPPQHPLPERQESEYVALVSGLNIGRNKDSRPLRNHVLVDYLAGRLGDEKEREFVSKIVRTVVVGNVIEAAGGDEVQVPTIKRKTAEEMALEGEPLKNADELVSTLAAAMCVDLMPGASDPSNYTLPQQSFHPCLFPRSSHFKSFRCVTNPYEAQVGGVQLFGDAGQPLHSMLQCTLPKSDEDDENMATDEDKEQQEQERALDYLQRCVEWRHAAPTAPDILACFPMANEDPFILETCPHVYFSGNQPRFSTRLVKGGKGQQVRLITVPSFSETSTIVISGIEARSSNLSSHFPICLGLHKSTIMPTPEELLAVERISAEDLATALRSDDERPVVVDVHNEDYELLGHIKDAEHLPSDTFKEDADVDALVAKFGKKQDIVFHCGHSNTRGPTCALRFIERAEAAGVKTHVRVLAGGFADFAEKYAGSADLVTPPTQANDETK